MIEPLRPFGSPSVFPARGVVSPGMWSILPGVQYAYRTAPLIHHRGGVYAGYERPVLYDPAKGTAVQVRAPEEFMGADDSYSIGTPYCYGWDGVRHRNFIYYADYAIYASSAVAAYSDRVPRLHLRRLNLTDGSWLVEEVLLPRFHNCARIGVLGVIGSYLVVFMWNPFHAYAVPVDRLNRVESMSSLPQFHWLTRFTDDFMSVAPTSSFNYLLRSFKAPGETGTAPFAAMFSVDTTQQGASSSLAGVIDVRAGAGYIRFVPDIRYNLNGWIGTQMTANVPSATYDSMDAALALDHEGWLSYRCSPTLAAVCDLKAGTAEAKVLPFTALSFPGPGYGLRNFFLSRNVWAVLSAPQGSKGGGPASLYTQDLYTGETEIHDGTLPVVGTYSSSSYYPQVMYDDAGWIWAFSAVTFSYNPAYPVTHAFQVGAYLEGGIRSADKRLGLAANTWKSLWARNFTANTRDVKTHLVKTISSGDNPFDASQAEDGAILTVANSRPTLALADAFRPAPLPPFDPDLDRGKVLGSDNGEYAWLNEPKALPDWFNGCTPVWDGGERRWRAGDALVDLPRVRRDNVTFVSKGGRWEPRVMAWTFGENNPANAFPHITHDRPCYPMYVSGAMRHWATDAFPAATGGRRGYLWGCPTNIADSRGADRDELGVCGALNNYWWEGSLETSNRRFSNFWPVSNTGTGRHEVGDMLFTVRPNLDHYSDSWHEMTGFSVVCRINNFEPGCMYGEEHYDMYLMLGRFMARQWMRGAVAYAVPIRFEAEIADSPSFDNVLAAFDTSLDAVGWQFEHTDGGQSAFLPAGPSASTVVGVVFDPRHAGFAYDRTLHFFRWRKYVNNAVTPTEWAEAEMTNHETNWRKMALVENQRFVNHVVVPELGDPPFPGDSEFVKRWLFSKKPSVPVGGHAVFIPALPGETRPVLVEIEIGDGVWFAKAERSSYATDPEAWAMIDGDGDPQPYPAALEAPAGISGFLFDPVAAGFESRAGTRFCRYRYVIDGSPTRWKVIPTVTSESSMLRTDNMNVVALGYGREDADTPVRLGRIPLSDVTVLSEVTTNNGAATEISTNDVVRGDVAGGVLGMSGRVAGDEGGRVIVLSHGLYRRVDDEALFDVVWHLHNKRRDQLELPPVFEMNLNTVVKSWRSAASARDTYNRQFLGETLPYGDVSRVSPDCAAMDYIPGSTIVSRITPNFDVNPQMYSYGRPGDFGDEAGTAIVPVFSSALSPDRRFFALRGVTRTNNNLAGNMMPNDSGYIMDYVLGAPLRIDRQRTTRKRNFMMCVDGGLFWDHNSDYDMHVRLWEPNSGLFTELPYVPFWESLPIDAQAGAGVFSTIEHIRDIDATVVRQLFGEGRTYIIRRGAGAFEPTRMMFGQNVFGSGSELERYYVLPANDATRGSGRTTGYFSYSGDGISLRTDVLRLGKMLTNVTIDLPPVMSYQDHTGRVATFPMYSGMYPRVAFSGTVYEVVHHVRLPGNRIFQAVGTKNAYDRMDTGVVDAMTGGVRTFLPLRDVTVTNSYAWGTALLVGGGFTLNPQDYNPGGLVVGTFVGEAVPAGGVVADGYNNLDIWQDRGR
jgi:hypothetical protein